MGYYQPQGQYPSPGYYPQQPPYPPQPPNNAPTIAMVLEIIFGLFGIMGMGWLYIGRIGAALLIFFGFWILLAVEVVISVLTGGICACVLYPLNIGLAIWSGMQAQNYAQRTWARGSILNVIIAGVVGLVLVGGLIAGIIALVFALGLAGSLASGY